MGALRVLLGPSRSPKTIAVQRIMSSDVSHSLKRGWDDFLAVPSHLPFLCVIYPMVCLFLFTGTFHHPILPLAFSVIAGLALVAPLAAAGLFELSRRRETGLDHFWGHALHVVRSPSLGTIVVIGFLLMAICLTWLWLAKAVYVASFGSETPASIGHLVDNLFKTSAGWRLIMIGSVGGYAFTALVLTITTFSLPLLIDRDVGVAVALLASIRVMAANPAIVARWGLIVTALLVVGAIPFFLCLSVVIPVLVHASWHLYRRAIGPETRPDQGHQARPQSRRHAGGDRREG